MNKTELRVTVLLSIQSSSLGLITPNIRGLTSRWSERDIILRTVIDGDISDEDRERANELATELIAKLPNFEVTHELVRCDSPGVLQSVALDAWTYARFEPQKD